MSCCSENEGKCECKCEETLASQEMECRVRGSALRYASRVGCGGEEIAMFPMGWDMPQSVKILAIKDENPFVKTFTLDVTMGALPGQFVMLWIPRVNEKPFSVSFDDGVSLQCSIAKVGPFTETLFSKKVGDKVGIRGPYGQPFEYEKGEHLAVVGGGYGAAPLYFLAHEAVRNGCTVDFIMGARSAEYLLFTERAGLLKNTKVYVATDDGSRGEKGYNTLILKRILEEGKKKSPSVAGKNAGSLRCAAGVAPGLIDRILTVGPEGMMKAVSNLALKFDVPCEVSVERYMKCGFGVCGQCVIDDSGIPTCLAGPVMDHQFARQQAEFGSYHRDAVGRKVKG